MQVQGIEDSVMVVEVVFPSQFSACCASLFGSVVLVEDLMEEVPQQHLSWWVSAALFDFRRGVGGSGGRGHAIDHGGGDSGSAGCSGLFPLAANR